MEQCGQFLTFLNEESEKFAGAENKNPSEETKRKREGEGREEVLAPRISFFNRRSDLGVSPQFRNPVSKLRYNANEGSAATPHRPLSQLQVRPWLFATVL